jgi:hypothetical protein
MLNYLIKTVNHLQFHILKMFQNKSFSVVEVSSYRIYNVIIIIHSANFNKVLYQKANRK